MFHVIIRLELVHNALRKTVLSIFNSWLIVITKLYTYLFLIKIGKRQGVCHDAISATSEDFVLSP